MPLYIKDDEVSKLADELTGLTKSSKTEAVRLALKHEIGRRKESVPLRDRIAGSLAMAQQLGPFALRDHKKDTDEMWGED